MFDLPTFRVGRVFGIPIEVNATWLIIFGLLSFTLATGYYPSIAATKDAPTWQVAVVAVVSALLFFASVVLHELGHSLVARAGGVKVNRITLFLLGGVSQMEDEPHSAGREFVMAFAGPAVSFVIALLAFIGGQGLRQMDAQWWLWAPLGYLALVNMLVGIFNLLPGFPLDGGRVLRSILWGATGDLLKATKWAARVGQVIGWGMVLLFVFNLLSGGSLSGGDPLGLIWLALIGWFVASMAATAYRQALLKRQLSAFSVRSAMSPSPQTIPGEISLEDSAHLYFLGGRHSRYPVLHGGQIIGLITLPMLKDVPRDQWPFTIVAQAADRDLAQLLIDADAHVDEALVRLAQDRPGALLVVAEGRLVGILTRSDVVHLLQRGGAAGG